MRALPLIRAIGKHAYASKLLPKRKPMNDQELYAATIDGLTALIRRHMSKAASRGAEPSSDPDGDDRYIRTHNDAVLALRAIRQRLENIEAQKDYLEP